MNDDRIVRGTTFDFVNLRDGVRIKCGGSKAINGFRGQRDDFARAQQISSPLHRGSEERRRVSGQYFRVEAGVHGFYS